MRKLFRVFRAIAIAILLSGLGFYFMADRLIDAQREAVWSEVLSASRDYVESHPEVTQEEIDKYANTLYRRVLKEKRLL